jgi:DNA recombination protein RmuC
MDTTTFLILAFGAAIIALLLLLLRRPNGSTGEGSEELDALKSNASSWETRWKEDRLEFEKKEAALRSALDEQKETSSTLRSESVRLETELQAAKDRLLKEEQDKEEQEAILINRFKVLSSDMLQAGTERLKKTSKEEIDALLKPFGERLDQFGKQVRDAYGDERKQQGELSEKLKQLFELNQKMTEEAHNLTQALTGNTKVQGDWGELQLETLLQNAGLEKDVHYEMQDTARNDEGKLLRPDFIVRLPDNRMVVIDSKVSLTAYANWTAAEDKETQKAAMKSHYGSMERHVRDLGEQRYQDLYGTTPDFVLMYIPVEPALSVDFDRQDGLYQMAAGKKVVPVTTSTLLATLRLISFLWKQESQKKNAEAIAARGQQLLKKFNGFLSDLKQVGTRLEQAQSAHNGAFQKLSKGSGNLISQAEKLRQLSSVETPLSVDPVDVEAAVESHENDESPLQISNSQTTEAEDGDSSTNLPPQ